MAMIRPARNATSPHTIVAARNFRTMASSYVNDSTEAVIPPAGAADDLSVCMWWLKDISGFEHQWNAARSTAETLRPSMSGV
jgi:hypothetical protein